MCTCWEWINGCRTVPRIARTIESMGIMIIYSLSSQKYSYNKEYASKFILHEIWRKNNLQNKCTLLQLFKNFHKMKIDTKKKNILWPFCILFTDFCFQVSPLAYSKHQLHDYSHGFNYNALQFLCSISLKFSMKRLVCLFVCLFLYAIMRTAVIYFQWLLSSYMANCSKTFRSISLTPSANGTNQQPAVKI